MPHHLIPVPAYHAKALDRVASSGASADNYHRLLGVVLDGTRLWHDSPNLGLDLLFTGLDNNLPVSLGGSKRPERVESRGVFDITGADVEAGCAMSFVASTHLDDLTHRRARDRRHVRRAKGHPLAVSHADMQIPRRTHSQAARRTARVSNSLPTLPAEQLT